MPILQVRYLVAENGEHLSWLQLIEQWLAQVDLSSYYLNIRTQVFTLGLCNVDILIWFKSGLLAQALDLSFQGVIMTHEFVFRRWSGAKARANHDVNKLNDKSEQHDCRYYPLCPNLFDRKVDHLSLIHI